MERPSRSTCLLLSVRRRRCIATHTGIRTTTRARMTKKPPSPRMKPADVQIHAAQIIMHAHMQNTTVSTKMGAMTILPWGFARRYAAISKTHLRLPTINDIGVLLNNSNRNQLVASFTQRRPINCQSGNMTPRHQSLDMYGTDHRIRNSFATLRKPPIP